MKAHPFVSASNQSLTPRAKNNRGGPGGGNIVVAGAPCQEGPAIAVSPVEDSAKPEWLRIPAAMRIFGLTRTVLYDLITAGRVKSVSLRRTPGAQRGVRLIHYASLAAYIQEQAAQNGGEQP
jgi:hypothetical protein